MKIKLALNLFLSYNRIMQKCKECGEIKNIKDFYSYGGYCCKKCRIKKAVIYQKKRMTDPEYRKKHNKKFRIYQTERRMTDPEYRKKQVEYGKKWYIKNKKKIKIQQQKRMTDPEYRKKMRLYQTMYLANPENRERNRVRQAKKRNNPEYRKKHADYYRKWYAKYGRKRAKNYQEVINLWGKLNPQSAQISHLVQYAIKTGKIKKPNICETCKEKRKLVAHHEDYDFPFKINWLCYSCHKNLHNNKDFT